MTKLFKQVLRNIWVKNVDKTSIIIYNIICYGFAVLAQQAEHFLGKEEVGGSNPLDSSKFKVD